MNRTMLTAAARLVHRRDKTIISDRSYDPKDLDGHEPRVVHADANNEIPTIDSEAAPLLGSAAESSRPAAIA